MTQASFQTAVNEFAGFGVPGTLYNKGPLVASSNIINSGSAANNVFGRACSFTTPAGVGQNVVNAGNTGGQVYAGIIANPQSVTLFGGTSGPLSPSLTVPNFTTIDVVSEGILVVQLDVAANIGDVAIFNNSTGVLSSRAPGTQLPNGYSNAYATVYEFSLSAPGRAVIWIRPGATVLPLSLEVIPQTTIAWVGTATTFVATVAGVLAGDTVVASFEVPPTSGAGAAEFVSAAVTGANQITFTSGSAGDTGVRVGFRVTRAPL